MNASSDISPTAIANSRWARRAARGAEAAIGQRQAAEPKIFVDAELREEGVVLRCIGDAAGDDPVRRPASDVAVEQRDAAAAWRDQSDQRLLDRTSESAGVTGIS